MAVHELRRRMGARLLVVLALAAPCWVTGCGGADGSKPAPIDAVQAKKAREYMVNYREQMIAANKAKAKAEAKKSR